MAGPLLVRPVGYSFITTSEEVLLDRTMSSAVDSKEKEREAGAVEDEKKTAWKSSLATFPNHSNNLLSSFWSRTSNFRR